MRGRGNVKKRALKFDFLLGTLVQLQPVLATEIKVGLSADIASLGRARPKLLKMQDLADEPSSFWISSRCDQLTTRRRAIMPSMVSAASAASARTSMPDVLTAARCFSIA